MKRFYILDGSGFLFRAYYALPDLSDKNGHNVNAVFGFFKMIFKLLSEKPDLFLIALDSPVKTLRHQKFEGYKANRPALPDNFKWQISLVKDLIKQFKLPHLEIPTYEADDIIYTLVNQHKNQNEIYIVSGDKDLKQIIDQNVYFYDTMKGLKVDKIAFANEMGFEPVHMLDYLAILGDSSDNIPGIKGIGAKGAQKLISQYGTLENVYANIEQISGSIKDKLIESKDLAFQSKELASLYTVPDIVDSQTNNFQINIDYNLMKDVFVTQFGFASMEKVINDLKQKLELGQQGSLF